MRLLEPIALGRRTARNRVVFGPHETNLGRGRAVSDRHVAYYARRAGGGAGVIVVETASVHESDWPYERAPLASQCASGWRAVKDACGGADDGGPLVLASLGHAGGQGSSAYSQLPLWAPSRVPDVATREVPKEMEPEDIAAVVTGFEESARIAVVDGGLDGVEVNAGQWSLVRQFLSGLTNLRGDDWGTDRLRFARDVLGAVRRGAGDDAVVGLRLSCDELAPWAGITPEAAAELVPQLVEDVDYVTVVRGSIFTTSATRPDSHVEPGFNLDLARSIRAALPARVAVIAQGSIVDAGQAEWAIDDGVCDAVEMTRAQIADPDLVAKVAAGDGERVRPCILCNQACQVRDARNPLVSCVVEPSSGHEWEDPDWTDRATPPTDVLVVGGGVAGMECARVAALRGHRVTVAERAGTLGGMLRVAANGAGRSPLAGYADWLEAEIGRLGVKVECGREVAADEIATFDGEVVLCTGSRPGHRTYETESAGSVVSAADVLAGGADVALPDGPVAVWDPIGGPIGISVAALLRGTGREVALVTPDLIPGNELSRTGDLAPANTRLQSAGIALEKRSLLRRVCGDGTIVVEDRFTGEQRRVAAAVLVDAGYRLPDDGLWRATGEHVMRAGDCVAPRTAYEATLEGRRAAP
jgi:2,4-dienoyl-CoA reductase (NADPH2)